MAVLRANRFWAIHIPQTLKASLEPLPARLSAPTPEIPDQHVPHLAYGCPAGKRAIIRTITTTNYGPYTQPMQPTVEYYLNHVQGAVMFHRFWFKQYVHENDFNGQWIVEHCWQGTVILNEAETVTITHNWEGGTLQSTASGMLVDVTL